VLLLQQTPLEGGTLTPRAGVHCFELNTRITLAAVPKPGFQFLYWLGDVSNPTANRTIVRLDAPKIVIAVFDPVGPALLVVGDGPENKGLTVGGGGGAGGALFAGAAEYVLPRRRSSGGGWIIGPRQIIIPEPATVVLLALGSLFVFTRRRPKK